MRFIYGFIAVIAWLYLLAYMHPGLSDEIAVITCAIVAAGAMAGGA